jgi:CheY-like chemotaxis protein
VTRILIAEDEERIISFLRKGLEAAGYSTLAARTGPEALACARDADFDLLLLDLGNSARLKRLKLHATPFASLANLADHILLGANGRHLVLTAKQI